MWTTFLAGTGFGRGNPSVLPLQDYRPGIHPHVQAQCVWVRHCAQPSYFRSLLQRPLWQSGEQCVCQGSLGGAACQKITGRWFSLLWWIHVLHASCFMQYFLIRLSQSLTVVSILRHAHTLHKEHGACEQVWEIFCIRLFWCGLSFNVSHHHFSVQRTVLPAVGLSFHPCANSQIVKAPYCFPCSWNRKTRFWFIVCRSTPAALRQWWWPRSRRFIWLARSLWIPMRGTSWPEITWGVRYFMASVCEFWSSPMVADFNPNVYCADMQSAWSVNLYSISLLLWQSVMKYVQMLWPVNHIKHFVRGVILRWWWLVWCLVVSPCTLFINICCYQQWAWTSSDAFLGAFLVGSQECSAPVGAILCTFCAQSQRLLNACPTFSWLNMTTLFTNQR